MGLGYQAVDRKVIDYDIWFLDGGRIGLRGPRVFFKNKDYLCFIGAAQTFGRFVVNPFPAHVGSLVGSPSVNLGFSGAGPEYFLSRPALMEIIKNASILVIQSMSARSVSAGLFRVGGNNGLSTFLEGPRKGDTMLAQDAYSVLRQSYGEEAYLLQIAAAQSKWIELHHQLIAQAQGQILFAWVSEKKLDSNLDTFHSPVGTFPHFVTSEMVSKVRQVCHGFADCTFADMQPQPLINDVTAELEEVFTPQRFPGRPDNLRSLNSYYATPPMHNFIAGKITEQIFNMRS